MPHYLSQLSPVVSKKNSPEEWDIPGREVRNAKKVQRVLLRNSPHVCEWHMDHRGLVSESVNTSQFKKRCTDDGIPDSIRRYDRGTVP
jgi:hypothetical protein